MVNASSVSDGAVDLMQGMRYMFYAVGPKELAEQTKPPEFIPQILVLILIEFVLGMLRGKPLYRLNDTLMSVMLGAWQQLGAFWFKFAALAAHVYVYDRWRVVDLDPKSWTAWVAAMVLIELGYYSMHRTAHEYHVLWSAHSVHHSGEDYNLATALRQGMMQQA